MAQLIKGNYNALTWLQEELQQSLAQALSAMNRYIDNPAENALSDCIESIYQVKGTLEMLNLSGSSLLAEEMQQTAAAIRDKKTSQSDEAQEALVRALLLLPNYLKLLNEDFEDHPLSLLENINELRELRGAEIFAEKDLFKPALKIPLPDSIAPRPDRTAPKLSMDKQKLSHAFQLLLLNWLKNQDEESLHKMRSLTHFMRLSCQQEKTTLLWWAAETLLEALIHNGLDISAEIKQVLGKLVTPLKIQTEKDEAELLLSYPNDLLSTLLLIIAKASTQSANITLFKQTFSLFFFDHKSKIYGMSDNALGNANEALLEQLQDLKEQINQYDHDHQDNATILDNVAQQLQSMSDTLAFLEEYESSNLFHNQYEQLQGLLTTQQLPDDAALTELADTLLKVESLIQPSSMTVDNQLRDTVINECLLEMANIKEAITLMSQYQTIHASELDETAGQLKLIAGSLTMLNYPEAALLLSDTADKLKHNAENDQSINSTQLEILADILACCDLFLEGIRQHGQTQTDLLHDASEKLINFDTTEDFTQTVESTEELVKEDIEALELSIPDEEISSSITPHLTMESMETANIPLAEPNSLVEDSESDQVINIPKEDDRQFAEGIDEEIAAIFIEEAEEVLTELKQLLPQWIQHGDKSALSDSRRHFHTLKGSGRMAGATVIGELAWAVEQVLNLVIEGTRPDTEQVKQLVSRAFEHVPELLNRFASADMESDTTVTELMALSEQCLTSDTNVVDNSQTEELTLEPIELESPEQEISDSQNERVSTDFHIELPEQKPDAPEPAIESNKTEQPDISEERIELDIPSLDANAPLELIVTDETPEHITEESETESLELSIDDEQTIQEKPLLSDERIALDIPSFDETNVDETVLIIDEPETGDFVDTTEEITEPEETGIERYLRDHSHALSSVEQYIRNQQQTVTTTENAIEESAATDTLQAESETQEPQPLTSVERYIREHNRPLTSVEQYIRRHQQAVTTDENPIEESAATDTLQAESDTHELQPLTRVERYIREHNRPLTSVEQYIRSHKFEQVDIPAVAIDEQNEEDSTLSEEEELHQIFKHEAQEHITALQAALSLTKETHQIDKPTLRSIHSLKGCANIAQVTPMALIATELDQALRRLHAQNITLTNEQVDLLSRVIDGLAQILLSLDGLIEEPDIRTLADIVEQLKPAEQEQADTAVIDPEFLVVFLQETDELLDQYTQQLDLWHQHPEDSENKLALTQTLQQLHEGALQAQQSVIASVYAALSDLINSVSPDNPDLKQLLEQGYEQLNYLIETLLQNKPADENIAFPEQVHRFLEQLNQPSEPSQYVSPTTLDETEYNVPEDIDPELLSAFTEEAQELLLSSGQAIKNWQSDADPQAAHQLQRDLHTIKGGARLTGITPMADLTHQIETLVTAVNEQHHPADEDFFDLLQRCQDKLTEMQEQLANGPSVTTAVSLIAEISMLAEESAPVTTTQPSAESSLPYDLDETDFAIPQDVDADLLDAFTEESAELLLSSGNAVKEWQNNLQVEQAAQQLQRDLHTIKGGARLAGITPIADLTHQVESLVTAVHEDRHPANEDFFDLLQRCQDKLTEMQEQLAARQAVTTAVSLIAEIGYATGNKALIQSSHPTEATSVDASMPQPAEVKASGPTHVEQVRVRADLLDYLTNFAGEVSISRDRVTQQHVAMHQQLREMEETVNRLRDQLRKLEIETETQILFRYEDQQLQQNQEFDPLELDRFSMIQQLSRGLSESVTDLIDISQSMDMLAKETDTLLLQQSRLNTDLQHGLMNTRLLPFSAITPRLERIVRQTASELDKKAELSFFGAELELDRTILDRLVAPIEHILRNAIAHGLESTEQRLANGKNESGQLSMQIVREGSEMLLTIQDDGQGINVEKVKQKALALGLIEEDNIPNNDELIQLILTSGFSTADSISQIAGRGVGMDVVSNEIRELKGRLSIQSKPGKGTRFSIRLPLTLSVIQALLITVQDEQYAIPLGSVNAGERISVENIKSLLASNKPKYSFNGEEYDFIPLATLLDKPISLPEHATHQLPLLLFKSGEMRLAILVDAVNSNREIVIKPVGKQLGHITAITGATILGDGRVVFILDIPTLIDMEHGNLHLDANDAVNLERELEQIHDRDPIAMVVDDSITMRKASGNLLKRLGFDVMTARDGIDALSQLHIQKPDIILLDVEMPRMDGFEFASIVRNDINFRHLPIIMITSRTGEKHRERAMGLGVNAYLGKPYREDDLIKNMKKLLGDRFFQEQL